MNAHWKRLVASEGVAGTWHRGATSWAMTLVPGQSTTETTTDTGVSVESTDADLIGNVATFVAVVGDMPLEGDKFVYADANTVQVVLQVINPAGEKPWRYRDPTRTMMRIHCEEVED